MPDLTSRLLPLLLQQRMPGIHLPEDLIFPDYGDGITPGRSILNIPSSICLFLGIEGIGAAPLAPEILEPVGGGEIRRVILVLMDALALHRMQRWMAGGAAAIWGSLAQSGVLAPLTSIVPCTTSAALTSLWTGRSAAEHGITGYEMWLKEYGIVANTIAHAPITYENDPGSLARAGFSPQKFMPLPTLGPHLAAHGIKAFAFQHYSIVQSGLSHMFFNEVIRQPFSTAPELWVNVRRLVESQVRERQYIYVYWSEVDTFSHRYGPDDERTAAEFDFFSHAFEHEFLARLKPEAREGTLLILTADHGQVTTQPNPHYELRHHPSLSRRLHIFPTGEHRFMYFYIRPGQTEAVREYLERTWPNQFIVLDPAYAIDAGLFGPGAPHPHLLDRLGDILVVSRRDAYLWWGEKENLLFGRHGGLHPDEMLVPFLAVRL